MGDTNENTPTNFKYWNKGFKPFPDDKIKDSILFGKSTTDKPPLTCCDGNTYQYIGDYIMINKNLKFIEGKANILPTCVSKSNNEYTEIFPLSSNSQTILYVCSL